MSPPKLLSGFVELMGRIGIEALNLFIGTKEHLQRLDGILGSVRGRGVAIKPTGSHVLENNCVICTFYILLARCVQMIGRDKITELLGLSNKTIGFSFVWVIGLLDTLPSGQLGFLAHLATGVLGFVGQVVFRWRECFLAALRERRRFLSAFNRRFSDYWQ